MMHPPNPSHAVASLMLLSCAAACRSSEAQPVASSAAAARPDGARLYDAHCVQCHDARGGEKAPPVLVLQQLSPEALLAAMSEGGSMHEYAGEMSRAEMASVAEFVSRRKLGSLQADDQNRCARPPDLSGAVPSRWRTWGVDLENTRFAADGLGADSVAKLTLKWAMAFTDTTRMAAQPTQYGSLLLFGVASGRVYALDADSGCVHWSFTASAAVRTVVGGPHATGHAAYFGDEIGYAYALDAVTGTLLWKTRVEDHPAARIPGAPVLYDGMLYVPVSSFEVVAAIDPSYPCCKFRGSVAALEARTGEVRWKTHTIAQAPAPTTKTAAGVQRFGPSGAPIWSAPTIDTKKRLLYVGTGQNYSSPATPTSDAIIAMALDTGAIVWVRQTLANDAWNQSCKRPDGAPLPANCPAEEGPDFDFGAPPLLRALADGRRILVAGQKSGMVYGMDPDRNGEIVWSTRVGVGVGGTLGGIHWGMAADAHSVYVPVSDRNAVERPGGLYALDLASGAVRWHVPGVPAESVCADPVVKPSPEKYRRFVDSGCSPALSAAVTATPTLILSGGLDGHLRAYRSSDGALLWDFDTAKPFPTINGVPGQGGAIDAAGVTVLGNWLYANSGYGYFNQMPGNLLLAFSLER